MVTRETAYTLQHYRGLSLDVKPTEDVPNGSDFLEMDTGDLYYFDGGSKTWIASGTFTLSSIDVTTEPTKTEYVSGEELDLSGMVVKATFSNGVIFDVTTDVTTSPAEETAITQDTTVTVSYTYGEDTETDTFEVTLKEVVRSVRKK